MEVVLGVDIGTSSTKGVLATPAGQVLATTQRVHQMSLPRPGWAEMDAERIWWEEIQQICRALTAEATLRPAILYGIDSRATEEIAMITQRYGEEAILANAGKLLLSEYHAHRDLWTTVGVEPGTLALAGGTSTAGILTDWLRDLTGGGYEGIAFGIRHMIDLFDKAAEPARRTVAVGGGVLPALWTSIVGDVTGHTQLIPRHTIGHRLTTWAHED